MVARAINTRDLQEDRFVDWLFKLTGDIREETGLTEKKSAEVIDLVIQRVQTEYGGRKPYVHQPLKSKAILRRWKNGWTVNKIAADLNCSKDWVRKVVTDIPVATGVYK